MQKVRKQGAANDHLANERTYLAWVRTSIGIMAFGFVVVKFSIFVKQISLLLGNEAVIQPEESSSIMGLYLYWWAQLLRFSRTYAIKILNIN